MVSNGLSHRRRTLKRPIVCKNDLAKNCGACTLQIDNIQGPLQPGAPFPITFLVSCDPDPVESTYEVIAEDNGELVPVPGVFAINQSHTRDGHAGLIPGPHRLTLLAEQTTGCYWTAHVDYEVVP